MSPFDRIERALSEEGLAAALDELVAAMQARDDIHGLFEARKMQVRHELGLPLFFSDEGDDFDDATRDALEERLLKVCHELGQLCLSQGRLREGWMFLRPTGEKHLVAAALTRAVPDEENIEELIELALHENIDPVRGFAWLLEHYGACNAITTYDTHLYSRPRPLRQAIAGQLVRKLHDDLLRNVQAHVEKQEGAAPKTKRLLELMADRDWLFADHAYHIDTSHLQSVTRIARVLEERALLQLALDLAEYGRRLDAQFQYGGEEPFVDFYPAHVLYYRALLGENIEEALKHFRRRAEEVDRYYVGTQAAETYIELLHRIGRGQEAIEAMVAMIPPGTHTTGLAPSLLELSARAGNYDAMLQLTKERDDLISFLAALTRRGEADKPT